MGERCCIVKSSFKERSKVVEELAARNEGFRDLCDDFEIANTAMGAFHLSGAGRAHRRV